MKRIPDAAARKDRTAVRDRCPRRVRRDVRRLLLEVARVERRGRAKRDTVGVVGCMDTGIFREKYFLHGGENQREDGILRG